MDNEQSQQSYVLIIDIENDQGDWVGQVIDCVALKSEALEARKVELEANTQEFIEWYYKEETEESPYKFDHANQTITCSIITVPLKK